MGFAPPKVEAVHWSVEHGVDDAKRLVVIVALGLHVPGKDGTCDKVKV